MAAITVRANQDECLDGLLWRTLGSTDGLHDVLDANPGLAAVAQALPMGMAIVIPAIATAPATAEAPLVQLWD